MPVQGIINENEHYIYQCKKDNYTHDQNKIYSNT